MRTGTAKPTNRVVIGDIRDDFATKVYQGQPDPYEVGGPNAHSAFTEGPPVPPPAMTPPPGINSGSPVARSFSGNTVVPFPVSQEPAPARPLSMKELIEQNLPAPSMPDLATVSNARKNLVQVLRRLRSRADDHARSELNGARENYYDAIFALKQPFKDWENHVFELVAASAAYEAGREEEIATNFADLYADWQSCSLKGIRNPVEVGLTKYAGTLTALLTSMCDETFVPLRADERERWQESHETALQLAAEIRLDVVRLASSVIEALNPNLINESAMRLAELAHNEAKILLQPHNDRYDRGTVAIALHRMLVALSRSRRNAASRTVVASYHELISTNDSEQNKSLIRSYGNLARNATNSMIQGARTILKPSIAMLGEIAKDGETHDIRTLALDAQSIIAARLGLIDV